MLNSVLHYCFPVMEKSDESINTCFYQCFYFSFPPLRSCPWKKRWPIFLYLAWGVMQHCGVRKAALPDGNITFENGDGCPKPSVRAVTQIWTRKEKEERWEQRKGFPHLQQEKDHKQNNKKNILLQYFYIRYGSVSILKVEGLESFVILFLFSFIGLFFPLIHTTHH